MTSSAKTIPPAPRMLGLAGLAPFWLLALMLVTGITFGRDPEILSFALAAYGAVILSFTGGIRWGIAVMMEEQDNAGREYAISVVPSLLAWGVLLLPPSWQLGSLAVLIVIAGLIDYGMVCRENAPEWFGNLRLILAGGAAAALILAAIAG
jgi:hypothetical protein